jgi:hypothetical protein
MMHATRRWNRDHSDELQSAWMNGTGILVWDTVFGVWVGWNKRDRCTLRRMLRVQRALGEVLVDGEWTPLVDAAPEALAAGVYVSRFELGDLVLWTAINRGTTDYTGPVVTGPLVEAAGANGDARLYDVTAGHTLSDGVGTVPARSVTGVLGVRGADPEWLAGLLGAASAGTFHPDATFPARTSARRPAPVATGAPPADAIRIEPGTRNLVVAHRRRETGMYQGAPYVEEWKPLPPRLHDAREETVEVTLGRVAVAPVEVTAAEFAAFVDASGYSPTNGSRLLRVADDAAPGAPATLVNLNDARAYAEWAGARLPTEFEWQVAAGDPGFRRSAPTVWNWTESEHSDGITRFVMLKGGSDHESVGSDWYVDGGVQPPEFSLKLLLAGLGLERSTSIGFRLAWDVPASDGEDSNG